MTTTPEQLAKWREEFESKLTNTHIGTVTKHGKQVYFDSELEQYWQGYLRAKQETEQAMKLAKFGAMVMQEIDSKIELREWEVWILAQQAKLLSASQQGYAEGIEATIKELLND